MGSPLVFDIINLVLWGILIKPLFIIWVLSFCLVRHKSDRARLAFTYLKIVMPLQIISIILVVADDILFIPYWNTDSNDSLIDLEEAMVRTGTTGRLFDCFADLVLLMCIVEFGNGFLFYLSQRRDALQVTFRYIAVTLCVVLLALCVAAFGTKNAAYTDYFNFFRSQGNYYYDPYDDSGPTFNYAAFDSSIHSAVKVETAFDIIMLVASAAIFSFAVAVLVQTRANRVINKLAVYLLVVTILHFIRHLWNVIYDAAWVLPRKEAPLSSEIVDPILNIWVQFVILVLIFVVGLRKRNGLWSTPQPWTAGAGTQTQFSKGFQPTGQWVQYAPSQPTMYVQQTGMNPQMEQPAHIQQQGGLYYTHPQPPVQAHQEQAVSTK